MLEIKLKGIRHIYFKQIFIEKRIDLHICRTNSLPGYKTKFYRYVIFIVEQIDIKIRVHLHSFIEQGVSPFAVFNV